MWQLELLSTTTLATVGGSCAPCGTPPWLGWSSLGGGRGLVLQYKTPSYCWDPTMQERTLPKERKKERWTRGMGSKEVKEAKEEAKAKPAVASSGDLSFEALLAKHRAQ